MKFYNEKETIDLSLNTRVDTSSDDNNLNIFFIGEDYKDIYDNFLFPNIKKKLGTYIISDYNDLIYGKLKQALINEKMNVVRVPLVNCFNPFLYFENSEEVIEFVNDFFVCNSMELQDQYWIDLSSKVFTLIMLYVFEKVPEKNRSIHYVCRILRKLVENDYNFFKSIFVKARKNSKNSVIVNSLTDMNEKMYKDCLSVLVRFCKALPDEIRTQDINKKFDILKLDQAPTTLFIELTANPNVNSSMFSLLNRKLNKYANSKENGKLDIPILFIYNKLDKIGEIANLPELCKQAHKKNMVYIIDVNNSGDLKRIYKKSFNEFMRSFDYGVIFKTNDKEDLNRISRRIDNEDLIKAHSDIVNLSGGCIVYQKGNTLNEEYQLVGKEMNSEEVIKNLGVDDEFWEKFDEKIKEINDKKNDFI